MAATCLCVCIQWLLLVGPCAVARLSNSSRQLPAPPWKILQITAHIDWILNSLHRHQVQCTSSVINIAKFWQKCYKKQSGRREKYRRGPVSRPASGYSSWQAKPPPRVQLPPSARRVSTFRAAFASHFARLPFSLAPVAAAATVVDRTKTRTHTQRGQRQTLPLTQWIDIAVLCVSATGLSATCYPGTGKFCFFSTAPCFGAFEIRKSFAAARTAQRFVHLSCADHV